MYSKEQVDDMLELVEKEFESALNKSEITEEEVTPVVEEETAELNKSEVIEIKEEDQTIDELYSSMNKSEKQAHYEAAKKAFFDETVEEVKIEKSESIEVELNKSEFDAIKAENEELKKTAASTTELLEKLFNSKSAPAGKAITGLNVISKSEGNIEEEIVEDKVAKMTKSEITSKLNGLNFGELKKSDRNAINEYCLNNISVESIKHLIKE